MEQQQYSNQECILEIVQFWEETLTQQKSQFMPMRARSTTSN